MSMLSPVLGFRPRRAGRLVVEKVPNPAMTTGSPFARQSWMASNTASTAAINSAFDREALLATWRAQEPPWPRCRPRGAVLAHHAGALRARGADETGSRGEAQVRLVSASASRGAGDIGKRCHGSQGEPEENLK